jgi:hypothetical protein
MEQLTDVELRAFKPGASSPFAVLDDSLLSVSGTETAQDAIDSFSVELESVTNPISGQRITSGDKLEFRTQLVGDASLSTRSVLVVRDVTDEVTAGGGVRRVSIEATDFVTTVLSFRTSDGSFKSTDVGSVVDTLVGRDAPEVGRSQIETVGRDTTININGRKTLDVIVQDLRPQGDAIVASDGTDLVFREIDTVIPKLDLDIADLHTPIQVTRVDDDLINRVRIDGGTDSALDSEQLNQTSTARVTDSKRETFQIPTRKSEIDSIEIFTVKDASASEGVIVRLQAARNGSAVDPNDRESDVARREVEFDALTDNGFTEFSLPDHDLAPAEDPFIIVEAADSTGHDVGVSNNGITFRAFFPFPLLARASAAGSVNEFRRRDFRRRDDQLDSEQAVRDAAQGELRHRTEPKRRISAAAATPRAHQLRPGEAVTIPPSFPVDDVSGSYICTERSTNFRGNRLDTELTLEDSDTL